MNLHSKLKLLFLCVAWRREVAAFTRVAARPAADVTTSPTRRSTDHGETWGSTRATAVITTVTTTTTTTTALYATPPLMAVSTALLNKDSDKATFDTTTSYRDVVQGPVVSYSESRHRHHHHQHHLLAPAVEGIKQMVDDARTAVTGLAQRASSLGVSFGLSYSLLSQINGGITLAVAWYMTCQRTGISPVYQWKALLKSYGALYAFLQAVKPLRIAAAISMARFSQRWLEATQERFQCGRGKAVAMQYAAGYVLQAMLGGAGICVASAVSGVPVLGAT